MHIGPYDDEPATVRLMHEYMKEQGYELDITDKRYHHEIYLSDARRVAPEKRKTVIRHPIKKKSASHAMKTSRRHGIDQKLRDQRDRDAHAGIAESNAQQSRDIFPFYIRDILKGKMELLQIMLQFRSPPFFSREPVSRFPVYKR
mgnify:CR=1 FL=1